MNLYLHSRLEKSWSNGPGCRAVLWLQGCTGMNCAGCWNPETHPVTGGQTVNTVDLALWVVRLQGIEGITISGGEPLQQYRSLLGFLRRLVFLHGFKGSIGLYSGYSLHELEKNRFHYRTDLTKPRTCGRPGQWSHLKHFLDFGVFGRFNRSLVTVDHPLCSSENQELKLFSERYTLADFKSQEVEMYLALDGKTMITTGFPQETVR